MTDELPGGTMAAPLALRDTAKDDVRLFWDRASCGEVYAQGSSAREQYEAQSRARYELEPYIHDFARFADGRGKDVLEIGVGMGADHVQWARQQPRSLTGVDLTPRAIEHTKTRMADEGLTSRLEVGDAEHLPFPDGSFDLVYSWGVLHHSPDTWAAAREVWRVLRPGGTARVMIYHTHSLVGYLLWVRYALLAGRPRRTLADVYATHLESPGTKAFSVAETQKLFNHFSTVRARAALSFGDLLEGAVGQRHGGVLLAVAKRVWPRWFFKRFLPSRGLMLLVDAVK